MPLILFLCLAVVPLPSPVNITVHDGDTLEVNLPGLPDVFGKELGIRLSGIDAPELHDPNPVVKKWAYEARDYLRIRISQSKVIILTSPSRDKYFRIDAKVILDGVDIQQELINKKYAKPYNGGTKSPWIPADIPPETERICE